MKKLSLLLGAFLALPLSGMAQTVITYTYDEAGNRTSRTSPGAVAAADVRPTFDKFDSFVFDFEQYYINTNNMLCSSNYGKLCNNSDFINKYWKDKSKETSASLKLIPKDNRKQNRI